MNKEERKPEVIVIAGPNGSGKTSITRKFLHHEWAVGTVYINPDVPIPKIISRYRKSIVNCKTVIPLVDRLYVYDNSTDNEDARPLFRLTRGCMGKRYADEVPEWAQCLLPED